MSWYLEELEESGMNLLVFCGGEVVFSSGSKGIMPLVEAIDALKGGVSRGLVTADRIVGRAAVLLNIYLGAVEVHALLISSGAKELLREHGVRFEFREETDAIKMKDGVIFCPFERIVQGVSDPGEAYLRIKGKTADV
ncbi:MAG: DUF1893 domain-containing protein [Candidatus Bathyarchaeota archaeon]